MLIHNLRAVNADDAELLTSFAAVLAGDAVRAPRPGLTVRRIADPVCVGGWPGRDLRWPGLRSENLVMSP